MSIALEAVSALAVIRKLVSAFPKAWRESAMEAALRAPRPAAERLSELSATVATTAPWLVSERIGSIIRDELASLDVLPAAQYKELTQAIVQNIVNVFKHILISWKGHPLYIKDLEQVWISCEPPLEIVDGSAGSLDVLLAQLEVPTLRQVAYFVRSRAYLQSLRQTLEGKGVLRTYEGKVTFVQVTSEDALVDYPVVLYRNGVSRWWGVRGRHHPTCKPCGSGVYALHAPLSEDWISYVEGEEAAAIAAVLSRHLPGCSKQAIEQGDNHG